jgi:cyanophycinase
MKSLAWQCMTLCFCLLALSTPGLGSAASAAKPQEFLLLAGGALPLCSSINIEACNGTPPAGRRDAPSKFIADANGQRVLEVVDFNASKSTAAKDIYRHFVAMAKSAHLARTGKAVLRPRIGILTSASSDPFDAVDFYLGAFQQAGARAQWLPLDAAVRASFGKDCGAIAAARTALTGETDRAEIYPDLAQTQRKLCLDRSQLGKILADLDGLFFNGGDQSLSKAAWFDGAQPIFEFTALQARVKARTLAIGGTSAGTAVMSKAAMITNGTSIVALKRGAKAQPPPPLDCTRKNSCPKGLVEDDLTYEASGGLGLFTLGILDTHFAARERQGRLAQLLIDSGTRFGFGVDETTALIVAESDGRVHLRAMGAGSVWIFDAKGVKDAAALAEQARLLKPGEIIRWPN